MHKHLTEAQVKQLRDYLKGHHLEALIMLALVTGLRRDELLSLKWQEVDLDSHTLQVQNLKTKSSARMIPIPEDVTEILKHHHAEQLRANAVWSEFVFPGATGIPLTPRQLMKEFHEVRDLAGLPRISFHDLRSAVGQSLYNTIKQKGREHNDHENA